jgi:long-chain acyl-CoA synthetase
VISSHAARDPAKPAAIMANGGESLTYGELERRSRQLARLLRERGLLEGDRVAILMESRLDWFVVMWAARRSSLRFVPINWHLKAAEARYVLENSDAKAIVTSERLLDLASELVDGNDLVGVRLTSGPSRRGFESLSASIDPYSAAPLDREYEGGAMPYSSGTSGRPKGILRPLTGAPFGTPNGLETLLSSLYELDERTIYLSPAPQYHAAPVGWTMAVMGFGGTVVVLEPFDAEGVLKAIETYRVTHAQFVPTHFVRLLKLPPEIANRYDLSSLRWAIHAAAPCPPEVKLRMMDWWGPILHEYYGGSERFGFASIGPEDWLTHRGSVGRSRMGPVHVVDPDTGWECEPRTVGLIYLENTEGFAYHKDPDKTRECLSPSGWGTHGDMGWVDSEGFIYLADRQSNMIISGGVNIYPQEVENVLITHPSVSDVAVIGVPNAEYGEEVKAVVKLVDGLAASPDLAAQLMALCRAEIAGFKCPKSVDFVDELPRHPNGKLLKRELRAQYWPDARVRI